MTKWMRIAALVLLPVMAACEGDDGGGPDTDPGDEVETIRLAIGTQTVELTNGTANRAMDIPRGNSTMTATFLRANGTAVALPATGSFSIVVTSVNNARVTSTQVSPYVVTLNGLQSGPSTLQVSLRHGSHDELGPWPMTVNVAPATDN